MAKTVNPCTPLVSGVKNVETACTAETVTIAATTAQAALNLSKLLVSFRNVTSVATVITLAAGDDYSEIGQGDQTLMTLGVAGSTTETVIVGGKSFESARFQDSDGYLVFTIATTAASVYVSASMLP